MSERGEGESVAVRGPWRILFLRNGHASAAKMLLRLPRSPKFITASRYKSTRGSEGGRGGGNVAYTAETHSRCFLRAHSAARDSVFQVQPPRSLFHPGPKNLPLMKRERTDGREAESQRKNKTRRSISDISMYLSRGFPDGRIPASPSASANRNVYVTSDVPF